MRAAVSHGRRGTSGDEGKVDECLLRIHESSRRKRRVGVEREEGGGSVVADSRFEEAQG